MNFFDNYTKRYFFLPIYFIINVFREINFEYINYVKLLYDDNDNTCDNTCDNYH